MYIYTQCVHLLHSTQNFAHFSSDLENRLAFVLKIYFFVINITFVMVLLAENCRTKSPCT